MNNRPGYDNKLPKHPIAFLTMSGSLARISFLLVLVIGGICVADLVVIGNIHQVQVEDNKLEQLMK